ncbi:hypothetical protein ALO_16961, partial [Acetonema longum DSM 6540]
EVLCACAKGRFDFVARVVAVVPTFGSFQGVSRRARIFFVVGASGESFWFLDARACVARQQNPGLNSSFPRFPWQDDERSGRPGGRGKTGGSLAGGRAD